MLDQLTYETINPHVGSTFLLTAPNGQSLDLKLVRAGKVMESEAARLKRTAFSLFFLGPVEPFLPQGLYPMSHPALGQESTSLFIVPVGRDAQGVLYEAVFT